MNKEDLKKNYSLMPERSQIRVSTTHVCFKCNEVFYTWIGGFGAVISSCEKGVKKGDIRAIGNVLFYAFSVETKGYFLWSKQIVNWSTVAEVDAAWLQAFKKQVFNCYLGND